MTSLAASIPPEIFAKILGFVGDKDRLGQRDVHISIPHTDNVSAVHARQDEMRHLSTCALTCVYWAQLTRHRMFRLLILRSSKDLSVLQALLRAPQSPRIPPIHDTLRYLRVYHTLGDHLWFHNLAGLKSYYQVSNLVLICLYIPGPVTPSFAAASTRGSLLHPLFFAAPRSLPIAFNPKNCHFLLSVQNIRLPNPTVLFNLLQDCLSMRPRQIYCTNLTWDVDSVSQVTPSSVGLKYACRTELTSYFPAKGCTDDVLVAAMVKSIPHHDLSQRRQGPHLSPPDTSRLFDVMHITWLGLSTKLELTQAFRIASTSDFDAIQRGIALTLPPGINFCLEWRIDRFEFRCIASRPLDDADPASSGVRNVTHIIIDLRWFDYPAQLREHTKTANIDWDAFLSAVRWFPHLQQVAIQCTNLCSDDPFRILVEFVSHLGEAWTSLGSLLGLYHGTSTRRQGIRCCNWDELQLDIMMDEIKRKREEIEVEKATSDVLGSGSKEESFNE